MFRSMVTINATLGLTWSILSFVFFILCRYLINPITYYRHAKGQPDRPPTRAPYIRTWLTHPDEERWQRLNLLISWVHALITGSLVIYSFWAYAPELRRDFVHHVCFVTYFTCSLSFGRFHWHVESHLSTTSLICFRILLVRLVRRHLQPTWIGFVRNHLASFCGE